MEAMIQLVTNFIRTIKITDLIDIVLVGALLYYLLKMIRETRAMQLIKGLIILFVSLQISAWMNLTTMNFLLKNTMQVGMFAIVVIFQPELRSMLERVGRSKVGKLIDFVQQSDAEEDENNTIDEIVEACINLSRTKTGALIVLERETKLGDVIKTGTLMQATITSALLENIFVPNTPLHDGAVVIREDKILTAGCLLPLTSNQNLSRELGTRHRAALGMSEASDALVVVVSEETGTISLAVSGGLTRNLNDATLRHALIKGMSNTRNKELSLIKFWKGGSK
ncbi:MAG: TIGR00159 family protein [Ruminococcaceae bacterium]|nr:TIGR00159 family protein [Oscillospiraceae bacterium]